MKKAYIYRRRENGIALVFILLMLSVAMGLALVTARMTLMGDKASRNDRDRQIAFQAAELALNDAELDIMDPEINHANDASLNNDSTIQKSRGCLFGNPNAGLVAEPRCSSASSTRGICGLDPSDASKPLHQYTNWEEANNSTTRSYVNFGEFTNRDFTILSGIAPAKKPKYIIFQTTDTRIVSNDSIIPIKYAYKVYALGYGANEKTQVMLEGEFYKPILDKSCSN